MRYDRLLALAGALLGAQQAQAKLYVLTVTGMTQSNADAAYRYDMTDRLGIFGAPGALLMGQAFTMTFRIDTGEPWVHDVQRNAVGLDFWD